MIPQHIYDELLSLQGYLTYSPYAESRWLKPLDYLLRHVREGGDRQDALRAAALIADQVEAKAEPGRGKDTAAEIGQRIRALMEAGAMSDLPTKTYPPEFLQRLSDDHEAEQAGATPEDSSAVRQKEDTMNDMRSTKSADTRAVEAYIQQSQRRDRYIAAISAMRRTLTDPLSPPEWLYDAAVELLDALLDFETGGRDE